MFSFLRYKINLGGTLIVQLTILIRLLDVIFFVNDGVPALLLLVEEALTLLLVPAILRSVRTFRTSLRSCWMSFRLGKMSCQSSLTCRRLGFAT